ncbi:hypothetical protein [Bradyrhizobium genosp. P]|uniref:hypothetical protein n=1 Tax=Bradyrhizobium genosp. P TaxID=83641 RepID=UPI003CE93CA2
MHDSSEERTTIISEAWTVLAAAKSLDDTATAVTARRIIADHLSGKRPRMTDVREIEKYFR